MGFFNRPQATLGILALWIMLGWLLPVPAGLTLQAWHCLIIFIVTIFGVISSPFPLSVMALLGAMVMVGTGTLSIQDVFSSFGSKVVWIVVFAFFIAKAFIQTGLGRRIAYFFIARIGHSVLGLSYGLLCTEWLLSPLIPSIAARSGGIIYPIAQSVIATYGAQAMAEEAAIKKTGAFLMNVCQHASIVSSAMFLTAMAGNPLAAELAHTMGINISWSMWALGACVPGVLCLLLLPWVMYKVSPPGIHYSPHGPQLARDELRAMGPMSKHEKMMLGVFILLIIGWTTESLTHLDPTTVTIGGVLLLIIGGVLRWEEAVGEKSAWDTMVWFAVLLALSHQLERLGVMQYLAAGLGRGIGHGSDPLVIGLLLLVCYFYTHYFFASLTAHITVLYALFLNLMIHASLPPMASALLLGYLSNLFGGLTHYGSSAAPIFFGSGYQSIQQWWYVGAIVSTWHLVLWLVISALWLPIVGVL